MLVRTALLALLCAWMVLSSLGRRCRKVQCPRLSCANPLRPPPRRCCSTCGPRQCYDVRSGANYDVGADVPRRNPCNKCKCASGGQVVCASPRCAYPSCSGGARPVRRRRECCPTCPHQPQRCFDQGTYYNVGDEVPRSDPCLSCGCVNGGRVRCASITCDIPDCGDGVETVTKKGDCCPTCPRICFDKVTNTNYTVGDKVPRSDPCMDCTCAKDGQVGCLSFICVIPDCDDGVEPVTKTGDCCPSCPRICFDKVTNANYTVGDKVPRSDPCMDCTCANDGQVECAVTSCAPPNCGDGVQPITKKDECCPTCPQICFDRDTNANYTVGDKVPRSNPCLSCTCAKDGQVGCVSLMCAIPDCDDGVEPVTKTGDCCPSCPRPLGPL